MDQAKQRMKFQSTMLFVDVQSTRVPPRIPVELQDMVIRSLALDCPWTDAATLAKCALTCRDWYRMVAKVLYNRVHIFGRRSFKLLERTLKEKHALGHEIRVQLLSIHDVTPDEHTSLAYLHTPLSSMKLYVKELLISGPHCSKDCTFPFRRALLADLPLLKALQHLHFYQVEFQSLGDLRRILAAIPNLRSLALREVSWKGPEAEFKPLYDTTSWKLSHLSLSHCSSNFVAPIFWALPPQMNETNRQKCKLHPTLWDRDITTIIELAKFCLGSPMKEPEEEALVGRRRKKTPKKEEEAVVAESICWEWRCTTNGTSQWFLECCIDQIASLENSTYICFLLGHRPSISIHESLRVVGIHISIEKQTGFDMSRLDALLYEFEALETLHINLIEPSTNHTFDSVIQQLPRWQEKIADQGLLPSQELLMVLPHDAPRPCCVETKNHKAYSRTLILRSLYRVKDILSTKGLEESVHAWEGILKAQRELVLINPSEYQLPLLDTLDRMADANQEFGDTETAIKHAMEAVEICRELDQSGVTVHTLYLAEALDTLVTYLFEHERITEAIGYHREGVETWRKLATWHNFEKHAPQFAKALDRMSTLSSKTRRSGLRPPSDSLEITDCQREAVDVWRRLATQDIDKYGDPLVHALHGMADTYLRHRDSSAAIQCRLQAVEVWRNPTAQNPSKYSPRLASALEEMADWAATNKFNTEAIDRRREAVGIWRKVAARDIDQYGDSLAFALDRMADTYLRHRDSSAAIKCRLEAAGVWRRRAAQDPHKYSPHLASALEKMADWASTNKFHAKAIDRRREVVDVWRKVAAEDINKYGDPLALALDSMADTYLRHRDSSAAIKCRLEALDVWRNRAAQNPPKYSSHLASALEKMADWATRNQFHTEAMDCQREAVNVWRQIVSEDFDKHGDPLPLDLDSMADTYSRHHDSATANRCRVEAVDVWNPPTQNPDKYYHRLTSALEKMADWASTDELHTESLDCRWEAVGVWRRLATQDIDKYVHPLTRTFNGMAETYLQLQDSAAATKCRIEAVDVWRNCDAKNPNRYSRRLASALEEMADWASANEIHTEAIKCRT
ncbi:hypothetical protein NLI96_g11759 [Meripilus lineatus]|uniref:F-box domain-containing protein n=1 Tax=Meripilus lineatus TaxID=2056292 RepID=A0AAD5YAJ8_9APHY|nr:hypothetical protein NLI96_g11759 [Physisporinus lineatus]